MKTYTKAVSATLAGALAVGMVPAMALADEAVDQELELQTEDALAAFNNATVNAIWNDNATDYVPATATTHSKNWTGAAQYVVIEGLDIVGTDADLEASDLTAANGYDVYYTNANGAKVLAADIIASGSYNLVIEAGEKSPYDGGKIVIPFTIAGKTFANVNKFAGDAGVTEYDRDEAIDAVNKNTRNWKFSNTPADMRFYIGQTTGVAYDYLEEGVDYTVKYFKAGVDRYNAANVLDASDIVAVGDYVAELTGIGDYAGAKADVDFKVVQYTLNANDIVIDDVVGATTALPTAPTSIKGSTALNGFVSMTTAPAEGSALQGNLGKYTATIKAVDTDKDGKWDDENLADKTVTKDFYKVAALATFEYDEAALPATWTTDLSEKKPDFFDVDEIAVLDANGKAVADTAYDTTIVKLDANGKPTTTTITEFTSTTAPGNYLVTVKVDPTKVANWALGGSASTVVTVTNGAYDGDETLYAYYGGKVVNSVELTYGEAFAGVTGVLKTSATAQEKNCDVKYYDANGKEVARTAIKNAGTYKAVLTVPGYELENNEISIVVKPYVVSGYILGTATEDNHGKKIVEYVENQEQELDFALWYDTDKDGKQESTDNLNATLPNGVTGQWVRMFNGEKAYSRSVKERGTYTFYLQLNAADAANIVLPEPIEVVVDTLTTFADVPVDYWAVKEIEAAAAAKYVNGHAGTALFTPDKQIKRADLICIAYNIAEANGVIAGDDGQVSEVVGFDVESYFSDVDNGAYYAQALYWAASAGIANGDKGKGTFRPMDTITRQEAAAIYYNLAKAMGYDMSAENVLAKYPDGSKVSGWAKGVMSWMADNGYMGQGGYLNPVSAITRSEAAVIAVRVFPTDSFGDN